MQESVKTASRSATASCPPLRMADRSASAACDMTINVQWEQDHDRQGEDQKVKVTHKRSSNGVDAPWLMAVRHKQITAAEHHRQQNAEQGNPVPPADHLGRLFHGSADDSSP